MPVSLTGVKAGGGGGGGGGGGNHMDAGCGDDRVERGVEVVMIGNDGEFLCV